MDISFMCAWKTSKKKKGRGGKRVKYLFGAIHFVIFLFGLKMRLFACTAEI